MRAILTVLLVLMGCDAPVGDLVPIPPTDTTNLESAVRKRIAEAHADFDRVKQRSPARGELAAAYGELAMVYHAQDLPTPAEAAYLNARKLAPRDKRWPYLLAHLYADASRLPEALKTFQAVHALEPDDAPTQIYLAQLYYQSGEMDKAQALFERAKNNREAQAAALAGLGKTALAQKRYPDAVEHLEGALKLWPNASRLRQPLAMAYRGLGDAAKAQANLARHVPNGPEPGVADPTVDLMSSKVVVSRVLLRRGQRYGKEGRFDLAEQAFRAAVASDPESAEARANLGISLANLGKVHEARTELAESVHLDESNALALFSLAVVHDRLGDDKTAREHYLSAVRRDPDNVQALVYLADLSLRVGSSEQAAKYYRLALDKGGASPRVAHSLAMALVKSGRLAEARKVLEDALAAEPRNGDLMNALARVLATAPAAAARDAPRALALAKELFEATRSLAVGQTYAMALAQNGRFEEAVKLQQETIIGYQRSKTPVDQGFLETNLRLYQAGRPARRGWPAQDAAFHPRSPAAARVATAS